MTVTFNTAPLADLTDADLERNIELVDEEAYGLWGSRLDDLQAERRLYVAEQSRRSVAVEAARHTASSINTVMGAFYRPRSILNAESNAPAVAGEAA